MSFPPSSHGRSSRWGLISSVVLLACVASFARAAISQELAPSAAPTITKVEPPDWWIGLTPRLMLLLWGRHLEGATISCRYPGFAVTREKVTGGGRYLFVWARIRSKALPGNVPCTVRGPSGTTSLRFPLDRRPPANGKFQGLSDSDVIYLIMVDRFADGDLGNDHLPDMPGTFDRSKPRAYHGGDLQGIIEHLNYLHGLGVTTLWLTPIVANAKNSPEDYHGYSAVDEYAVNEHFGSLAGLRQLVADAHRDHLKVLFDYVVNHVGPKNPWVVHPPEPDWFHGTLAHHLVASDNFQNLADPHAPLSLQRNVLDGWFANILPDLNQDNPDVAQYFIQNAIWWAEETGIDGYRLDTFPFVPRSFWAKWHQALHQIFPHFFTVGEVFNADPDITSFFAGGRVRFDGVDSGVTTVFDYPFYFALRSVILRGAPVEEMVDVLAHDRDYARPQLLVPFLGNHDVPRFASAPGSSMQKLKLAFSILLTMRGIPELYYGDEIGMTGGSDPDNRHDFPGGFPGDPQNAFVASGRTPAQEEIFSHVQRLLHLRQNHPALRRGQLWNIGWDEHCYAFARVSRLERLLIVFNAAPGEHTIHLSFGDTPLAGGKTVRLIYGSSALRLRENRADVTLRGEGFGVWSVQ
jgi:glycosidase